MRAGQSGLKPQDILVLFKIHLLHGERWTFLSLARSLGMSSSETHAAVKRAEYAQLFSGARRQVRVQNLQEFLLHGVRYAFAVQPGTLTRGIPTAWSTSPLRERLERTSAGPPLVWPDPRGAVEGLLVEPIYRTAPQAAQAEPELYALLALVDGLRLGRGRERALAGEVLAEQLAAPPKGRGGDGVLGLVERFLAQVRALEAEAGQVRLAESRVMEEVVTLLDREGGLVEALAAAPPAQRQVAGTWARQVLADPEHAFLIEEHLPRGPALEARTALVTARLHRLAAGRI